ncbi:MAG: hypothetical protein MJE63_12500, partial [Proteobacteria bacterium]|nr:hypothetical protein [Pseudomonadota bacterium]
MKNNSGINLSIIIRIRTAYRLICLIPIIVILSNTFAYGGEKQMRPVFSLEGLKLDVIPKKEYNLKNRLLDGVFPVLFDNAIGTNQVGNA